MSAFVVGDDHIDLMVTGGLLYSRPSDWLRWTWSNPLRNADRWSAQLDHTNPDEVGAMLLAENVRSVNARYQEQTEPTEYTYRATHDEMRRPALGLLFEALDCFEYQACESADWEHTQAAAFCDSLRGRLSRLVPGRGDGWDWRRPEDWQPSRLVSLSSLLK